MINLWPLNFIVLGLAVLGIGLSMRLLASFTAVLGGGFSFKECIFISLAWIPKATVQVVKYHFTISYLCNCLLGFTFGVLTKKKNFRLQLAQ